MKVVYIAGPYRSGWPVFKSAGIFLNILRARKVAKRIWESGHIALCPHSNSAFFSGVAAEENFLEGDLELLRRCDAIYMVGGWEKSSGARKERELAELISMDIIYDSTFNGWLWKTKADVMLEAISSISTRIHANMEWAIDED